MEELQKHLQTVKSIIPILIVVLTGAIGGCAASFHNMRKKKSDVMAAFAVGYTIVGIFGSLMTFAAIGIMYPISETWPLSHIILLSGISGFVTPAALATGNFSMRVILKQIGIEVEVSVKKVEKDGSKSIKD